MGTAALWNSRNDLLRYVATRFPLWIAVVLPLLLSVLALREWTASPLELGTTFVAALLLVFELRLWDDLADRETDCRRHPERVLCQTASLRPFVVLLGILTIANLCVVGLLRPWWSVALLLILHVLLELWYAVPQRLRWKEAGDAGAIVNYHLILLKYPLLVLLLGARSSPDWSASLLISAAMAYLGLCVFEVLHDGTLRASRPAWTCLAVDAVLLVIVGCLGVACFGVFG